ncbi:RluA family pseudouridine synthase [Mycoplasmatota bacterium]|nr:RluA family pseudouridine synthase [Mycoplasmatota bacterium]
MRYLFPLGDEVMEILYEDNHIIVVVKEPGILSQEDNTGDKDMLTLIKSYLKEKFNKPGNVFLGLIHRLDRMVGGVMIFAKTSKAASRLSEQVRNHSFQKKYLAVVHGKTKVEDTLINYLKKDVRTNTVYVKPQEVSQVKRAELHYKRIQFKDNLSLVDIDLKTGRPHQIRVQFSHIHHPLIGDKKYGKKDGFTSIGLYAYQLSVYHPTTKELLTFTKKPSTNFPFNEFSF